MTAKRMLELATFVVTLGLVLATVAVWILLKRRGKSKAKEEPFGQDDAIASILSTPGLTPAERKTLRRHVAKRLGEESAKDPKNLKKTIDIEEILRNEEKRPGRKT